MKVCIVIPARYGSSRFPGKPLVPLRGVSLVARTYAAAREVLDAEHVVIATDDIRIAREAERIGAKVVCRQDEKHAPQNGTERVAQVLPYLHMSPDIVVNLQGDSPLMPVSVVRAVVERMGVGDVEVATPAIFLEGRFLQYFMKDLEAHRVGGTTVVMDENRRALYFSKTILPHGGIPPLYFHLGIYAYTPAVLGRYIHWGQGSLEKREGLEQLRFLEHGIPVAVVPITDIAHPIWEVNNREDVPVVESLLPPDS